jgi:hypothetical protein
MKFWASVAQNKGDHNIGQSSLFWYLFLENVLHKICRILLGDLSKTTCKNNLYFLKKKLRIFFFENSEMIFFKLFVTKFLSFENA